MKTRGIYLITTALLACSQCGQPGKTTSIQNGLQLETKNLNVRVQFHAGNIARVVKWRPESSPEKVSLMVIRDSLPQIPIDIKDNRNTVVLKTGQMTLKLSKRDGHIEYFTADGQIILKETKNTVIDPLTIGGEKAFSVQQDFKLTPDEGLFGLGQHQNGYMNYRGRSVTLVQTNTDAVTPFLISTNGWGILWDNYSKTVFQDTATTMSLWSEVGDNLDYYLIGGANMDAVIGGYRQLTGSAPMYGKWAYGYWQSKEHYHTRDELLDVVKEYRQRRIPVDNIIQDWNYWGDNANWSAMSFDPKRYPEPKDMIKRIHDQNFHIMISIWPGLGPNTPIHKDMAARGYLFNTVGWASFKYFDAFNPDANDLYWSYVKTGLISAGIDALWIDSTEPDIINATTKAAEEYEMKKVENNYLGSWARYLNAYSLVMMDKLYQNQRRESEQKRVYMLTRSVYAGQQRAAATTWSGDIGASWEIYRDQISAGLNFCMAGVPYWTFDIGGFVIGAYGGVFIHGGQDPAYQELYTRMFQFGTFCPIFRAHGSETPREIWRFGEFSENLIKFDNLRYRLLPYIYSLAWRVTDEGYTMMRGLPMDFPQDQKTYAIADQYMFGPSVMVCPVTEYMLHRPPEKSVLISPQYFQTADGKPGLKVKYYHNPDFADLSRKQIEPDINHLWYTGRPDYMTDSAFAVCWESKLSPPESGSYQFHLISYDAKRLFIDGKELPIVYTSVEQYTDTVRLEAGREYDFRLEMQNRSTGAAKMILNWKTPEMFAREKTMEPRPQTRSVYLPAETAWIDFWTGATYTGGQSITADAPIDKIPLLIKAGSVVPLGPFVQYATEKPADPLELRIYPGADGSFTLYEDENDNYNYEKGIYATITFQWNDAKKQLTIGPRNGSFPGMLTERQFQVVLVRPGHGTGIESTPQPDKVIKYTGEQQTIRL